MNIPTARGCVRLEEVEGERSDLTFKLKEAEKFEKRVAQLTAENKDLSAGPTTG